MASFCNHALLTLMLLHSLSFTTSFLIDDQCIAPSPCTCSSTYIYCQKKSFSTVPTFKTTNSHSSNTTMLIVYLNNNHITTIPGNAFTNIGSVNAKKITFNLYSNKIASIQQDAFKGVENVTKHLDLHSNHLTSIPSDFSKFTALISLSLRDNPLQTLNPTVFENIGFSLVFIDLDLDHFTTWPTELHFLRNLTNLALYKIPFSTIEEHAFSGFENTLVYFKMSATKLLKIPNEICKLSNLKTLVISSNSELTEPFVQQCTMHYVSILFLHNNQLTEFPGPNLFHNFPSLKSLFLADNRIHIIKAEDIPYSSTIDVLDLARNRFNWIPNVINNIDVSSLSLIGNTIETIEDCDFTGLKSMTNLFINNNPIKYISPNAFNQNKRLLQLDLDDTDLGYVPASLMSLPMLDTLRISGKTIKCTCDMAYLKSWNITNINWESRCHSSTETVKSYILKTLQQCP